MEELFVGGGEVESKVNGNGDEVEEFGGLGAGGLVL